MGSERATTKYKDIKGWCAGQQWRTSTRCTAMNGFRSHAFLTCSAAATLAPIFIFAAGHWDILELGCFRPPMPNLYILDWEWDAVEGWIYDVFFKNFYTWELQMYGNFCRFRISAEFSDFALKNGFRRNSIIGDQFRRNWLLNVCPSKVRKHVGKFRRNCPQFRRNYPDSALVTNMRGTELKAANTYQYSSAADNMRASIDLHLWSQLR